MVRVGVMPIPGGIDDVSSDPQRVDSDDDRCADLHRLFQADLAAHPQVLDLHCLSFGQTEEYGLTATLDPTYAVGVIDTEATANLRDRRVRPRGQEPTKARSAGSLLRGHGVSGSLAPILGSPLIGAGPGPASPSIDRGPNQFLGGN